jgi:D-glycero-D-manno-heptose 1,7-bisphosphate phosphatase
MPPRRFVILDRDGTIMVNRPYLADPAGVELLPGAAAALRALRDGGLGLVIATNQSGIGRGLLDTAALARVHARLIELLAVEGATVDGIYYCPHAPADACRCRKPQPGMVEDAARDLAFEPHKAIVIGDDRADIDLGRRIGATTILVRSGHGARVEHEGSVAPDHIANDLRDAAKLVLGPQA